MKRLLLLSTFFLLFLEVQAQVGALDPSFGTNGFVRLGINYSATAFQSDGKLIGVQMITGGFKITRYTTNGSLDVSFGIGGTITQLVPGLMGNAGATIATQNNDNIIVQVKGGDRSNTDSSLIALVRFNNNGVLDAGFGTHGFAIEKFLVAPSNTVTAFYDPSIGKIAIQNDGKIVSAFTFFGFRISAISVSRYNSNGTPDNSFFSFLIHPNNRTPFNDLAIGDDGKIFVGGIYRIGTLPGVSNSLLLASLNNNGTPNFIIPYSEGDFLPPPPDEEVTALAIQGDGKILVSSKSRKLLRFKTNATLDSTFGTNGIVIKPFIALKIIIQSDGKMIVGGSVITNNTNSNFAVARYNPNGTLDPAFGTNGITTSEFGTNNEAITDMKIAGNRLYAYGRGILAVYTLNGNCIAPTFLNNSQIVLDATCGKNDGNISIIPTSGTGPFMYSINGGSIYVSGPNAGYTFMNLAAATYKLRLKDANGCESVVVERMVKSLNCPTCTPPIFLNNSQIVLDATCGKNDGNISIIPTSGNAPFMYSINGGIDYVSGPNGGYTFNNLAPGTYKLRLKDATGCESGIVEKAVNQSKDCPLMTIVPTPGYATGIAEMPMSKTAVVLTYPNPSKGQFRLQLQNFISPKAEVSIFDGKGTLIEKRWINAGEGSLTNFNLSGRSKGMYYIKIVSSQGIKSTKVVIQ